MKVSYIPTTSFTNEFKKLVKKYCTLREDLETLCKAAIELIHLQNIPSNAVVPIEGLCTDKYKAMKVRKFACRSLKGRGSQTGLRLIYIFDSAKSKVYFLEIYRKSDKENEDRARIKEFIKHLEKDNI